MSAISWSSNLLKLGIESSPSKIESMGSLSSQFHPPLPQPDHHDILTFNIAQGDLTTLFAVPSLLAEMLDQIGRVKDIAMTGIDFIPRDPELSYC